MLQHSKVVQLFCVPETEIVYRKLLCSVPCFICFVLFSDQISELCNKPSRPWMNMQSEQTLFNINIGIQFFGMLFFKKHLSSFYQNNSNIQKQGCPVHWFGDIANYSIQQLFTVLRFLPGRDPHSHQDRSLSS